MLTSGTTPYCLCKPYSCEACLENRQPIGSLYRSLCIRGLIRIRSASISIKNHLLNRKPGHTTGGSSRSTRRSVWERSGKIVCQLNHSPWKEKSTVPTQASKRRCFNDSPEARTSEFVCKPTEERDNRLTRGLSAVHKRVEERSLFLAADQ